MEQEKAENELKYELAQIKSEETQREKYEHVGEMVVIIILPVLLLLGAYKIISTCTNTFQSDITPENHDAVDVEPSSPPKLGMAYYQTIPKSPKSGRKLNLQPIVTAEDLCTFRF